MASLRSSCIWCQWLISNEEQDSYYTKAGCNLEPPVKDGGIHKLDSVHRPHHHDDSDRVTRCHLALNLKVSKIKHCLGKQTPASELEWPREFLCHDHSEEASLFSVRQPVHGLSSSPVPSIPRHVIH